MFRMTKIRTLTDRKSVRYLANALFCAIISNIIMIGGDLFGIHYVALVAIAWFITGTIAYILHVNITFRVIGNFPGYIQFMTGAAVGIPYSLFLFFIFEYYFHFPMMVAAPAVTITMFIYNYINARLAIIWSSKKGI